MKKTKHIKNIRRIHFMGIGGSGISGAAHLAEKMGFEVTGCDLNDQTAYMKKISMGHDENHVSGSDLVVASPAVFYQNSEHPEFLTAKKEGKLMTWEEFTGKVLMKGKTVIAVSGTHGKSTTTAMIGKLLVDAGLDPTVLVGAKVQDWGGNSRFGKGEYFVIEADEFFGNFLNYNPDILVINNIEFDHPDFFSDQEHLFFVFRKFLKNLKGRKTIVANLEDPGVRKLLRNFAKDLKVENIATYMGSKLKLKVFGKHNIKNAMGVWKVGELLGINSKTIKKSLESFTGIGRRLELIYSKNGIKVYDDYAHHPTAIRETLSALRSVYPNKRIWAIDEPHGFSRTRALLPDYHGVFADCDIAVIGPIFKARDLKTFSMTPEKVAKVSGHKNIYTFKSFADIKKFVSSSLKKGDIVLVMGAGDSYKWAKNIV